MNKGFDEKLDLEIQNQNTNNSNAQENSSLKKKNRTLQFYKFLFYSIKLEIKFY